MLLFRNCEFILNVSKVLQPAQVAPEDSSLGIIAKNTSEFIVLNKNLKSPEGEGNCHSFERTPVSFNYY